MATQNTTRRNEKGLPIARAVGIAVVAMGGLSATNYYPSPMRLLIVAVAFGLSLLSPSAGIAVLLAAIALPMLVADLATGVVFAIAAAVALGYLSERRSSPFLVIGLAMVAASFGGQWAVPVLAGYLLGSSEGGIVAVLACVALEGAGLLLGVPMVGAVVAGGSKAAVHFRPVAQPFAFAWLGRALHGASAERLIAAFTSAKYVPALVAQPVAWGVAAWLAGHFPRPAGDRTRLPVGLAIAAACTLGLAGATGFIARVFAAPVPASALGAAGSASLVVAVAGVLVADGVFGLKVVAAPSRPLNTNEQEDADVDELLRMIAEAEDELASKHTSEAVVLITDMQSFSKMTEEDGSMVSAKMIQRHRDLLLPIIERFGGHGKSTGGDGLVAAFASEERALQAAVEMQRALRDFNASRPGERQLAVRIGLAKGEVVLDRNGRPFIGAGLNKAARVMSLADGGQVFAEAKIVASSGINRRSHGSHELKNIAEAVEIVELLWDDEAMSREAS